LLIKIIEMLTENRIAHLDNLIEDDSLLDMIFYNDKVKCSYKTPCMSLYIRKNVKPKKMKIIKYVMFHMMYMIFLRIHPICLLSIIQQFHF
jgi:hypothetical protein